MTDWNALHRHATDLYDEVLPTVTDWDAASPCRSWTARDVLAHVVDEQMWIPGLLAGGTMDEVADDLEDSFRRLSELTAPGLVEQWNAVRATVAAAWNGTPDDDEVHLSYGRARVGHYLAQQTFDLAVHAWDLAASQGVDLQWDEDLAKAVWEFVRDDLAENPAPELFDPPVPGFERAGDGASDSVSLQDATLAITGRNPSDWHSRDSRSGATPL